MGQAEAWWLDPMVGGGYWRPRVVVGGRRWPTKWSANASIAQLHRGEEIEREGYHGCFRGIPVVFYGSGGDGGARESRWYPWVNEQVTENRWKFWQKIHKVGHQG